MTNAITLDNQLTIITAEAKIGIVVTDAGDGNHVLWVNLLTTMADDGIMPIVEPVLVGALSPEAVDDFQQAVEVITRQPTYYTDLDATLVLMALVAVAFKAGGDYAFIDSDRDNNIPGGERILIPGLLDTITSDQLP